MLGLLASSYLLYTYVSGAPIVCGFVRGCDVVRASAWAYSFGIPRPFFGVVFYASLILLMLVRVASSWRPLWLYRLSCLLAVIGFVESVFLVLIQVFDLRAYCVWCFVSALSATVIALAAFFDQPCEETKIVRTVELKRLFVVFTACAFLVLIILNVLIRAG